MTDRHANVRIDLTNPAIPKGAGLKKTNLKQIYDVFLSHNSNDKPAVEALARKLIEANIKPWLDKWNLIPGAIWQAEIEEVLENCLSCAVFLGPKGTGPWQMEEMRAAINRRVTQSKGSFRVIPVLLPGGKKKKKISSFLSAATWVKFRRTIEDKEALHRLIAGILNVPPGDTRADKRKDSSKRLNVRIKMAGSIEDFKKVALAAQTLLQNSTGERSLTITYSAPGSVILLINCSTESFRVLRELIATGKLIEILGFKIENISCISDREASKYLRNQTATVQHAQTVPRSHKSQPFTLPVPAQGLVLADKTAAALNEIESQLFRNALKQGIDSKTAKASIKQLTSVVDNPKTLIAGFESLKEYQKRKSHYVTVPLKGKSGEITFLKQVVEPKDAGAFDRYFETLAKAKLKQSGFSSITAERIRRVKDQVVTAQVPVINVKTNKTLKKYIELHYKKGAKPGSPLFVGPATASPQVQPQPQPTKTFRIPPKISIGQKGN